MKLQTNVAIHAPAKKIDHQSKLLLIGSCFTEHIGQKLKSHKFPCFLNPCGIAYNPVSVANSIKFISDKKILKDADIIFYNELWHSLHHHGCFSAQEQTALRSNISLHTAQGNAFLKSATHICITLGTAWVFEHIETQQIVNNCHKLPAQNFRRYRLSVAATTQVLEESIAAIRSINPTATLVFTVSPVRHQKDGLHANQLSKSILLLAIEHLQQKQKDIHYFPAYELVMDELRDYRFYAEDLCHLNALGIEYIWEKFATHFISSESQLHFPSLQKLQKALNHKITDNKSIIHKKFIQKTQNLIAELEKKLPFIDFTEERKILQDAL